MIRMQPGQGRGRGRSGTASRLPPMAAAAGVHRAPAAAIETWPRCRGIVDDLTWRVILAHGTYQPSL